jgi:hypothetical protein
MFVRVVTTKSSVQATYPDVVEFLNRVKRVIQGCVFSGGSAGAGSSEIDSLSCLLVVVSGAELSF